MVGFENTYEPKVLAFEFVLKNLLAWHKESKCSHDENDLSTLKALKLLFFVSAVNAKIGNSNILVENVFDDFVAMPYGHVESHVYSEIRHRKGKLNFYTINNSKTVQNTGVDISELDNRVESHIKNEIVSGISALRKINPDLICRSAFELVELSHNWYSWKKTFALAQSEKISSKRIPSHDIINEDKIFSLEIF